MSLELCAEVSTPHHRFYHVSPDEIAQLPEWTRGPMGGISDFPGVRRILGEVTGYPITNLRNCGYYSKVGDGVLEVTFYDSGYQAERGKLLLRLACSAWNLGDGGLEKGNIREGDGNVVRVTAHALSYYRMILSGSDTSCEGYVVFPRFGNGGSNDAGHPAFRRASRVWERALSDFKMYINDDDFGVSFVFDETPGQGFHGTTFALRLDDVVDLPWMVDNGRRVLDDLSKNGAFNLVLNTACALRDAEVFMGDEKGGLAVLRQQVAAFRGLFPEGEYGSHQSLVLHEDALLDIMRRKVHGIGGNYIQRMEDLKEAQEGNQDFWKFLSMI